MRKHLFYVFWGIFTAVLFAAQSAMADCTQEIPTLNQWGMLGAAMVLVLGGAYTILKKKK